VIKADPFAFSMCPMTWVSGKVVRLAAGQMPTSEGLVSGVKRTWFVRDCQDGS
jgi:hypothetical protein